MYVMRRGVRCETVMTKLRTFFKRHILWVGLAAVVVPLLSIIALQYWSLLKLEKTSIVAGHVGMKNYLADVSKEVKMFYTTNAEQSLNVSAASGASTSSA